MIMRAGKTRTIGTHGTRTQTWTGSYWVEQERDGAFTVYFQDGRWLGWTDAAGEPKSVAGCDPELREDAATAVAWALSRKRAA